MQLKEIDWLKTSRLARALLITAKNLGITSHYRLAKLIGVDGDSVRVVLEGGRPNTRTAERYKTFISKNGGEVPPILASEPSRRSRANSVTVTHSRRPSALPPLIPRESLGFHQQLVRLSQVLTELADRLLNAHEQTQEASQHVTYLLGITKALDQDPALKGLLDGDPVIRAILAKAMSPDTLAAATKRPAKRSARTKGRTLTQKV